MRKEQYPFHLKAPLVEGWRIQYDQSPMDMPFFSGSTVFVREPNGYLAAFDLSKEKRLWEYETSGWLKDVDEGVLYFSSENDDTLHLIDAVTGEARKIHRYSTGYQTAVLGGLLVTEHQSCIRAVVPHSGERVWEFRKGEDLGVTTTLSGDASHLFVAYQDGTLRALTVQDGSEIWCHSVANLEAKSGAKNPGKAVGPVGKHRDLVIARVDPDYVVGLAADSGERVWTWTSEIASAPSAGAGYLYGDRFYLTGAGGTYHILDAATGQTILEVRLADSIPEKKRKNAWGWHPLLVSETHAYVGTSDGIVFAFVRDTGQYAWSFSPPDRSAVLGHFVSGERRLCYTDWTRLYCLEEKPKAL